MRACIRTAGSSAAPTAISPSSRRRARNRKGAGPAQVRRLLFASDGSEAIAQGSAHAVRLERLRLADDVRSDQGTAARRRALAGLDPIVVVLEVGVALFQPQRPFAGPHNLAAAATAIAPSVAFAGFGDAVGCICCRHT